MMGNNLAYKNTTKELGKHFKVLGFKGRGFTYRKYVNKNVVVLNIQKSIASNVDSKFTINIGVYSSMLGEFYDSCLKENPNIEDCQWSSRIGSIIDNSEDLWFYPQSENTAHVIINQITRILDEHLFHQLPLIANDENLLERWLSNKNSNVTEFDRLLNLTVLLRKYRNSDLNKSILELQKYASKNRLYVKDHIKKLNESN